MDFRIATIYPIYYVVLCLAVAALLTWLLYRKSAFESRILTRVMAALRFAGLFLLLFLLLSPLFRLKSNREQKPVLLFFTDVSQSVDSAERESVSAAWAKSRSGLEDKFDIREYAFASDVALTDASAERGSTSLSAVMDRINEAFEGSETGVAVISSDGIYNTGVNPLFKNLNRGIPLFTIGLGDTTQHPDVWVAGFSSNATAFIGNEVVLECVVRSHGIRGKNLEAVLYEDGRRISSKSIPIENEQFYKTFEFSVLPQSAGLRNYEIRLQEVTGESNIRNNRGQVWVNVTDTRRKIAICYHAPHPDVGALARSLEQFGQYAVLKTPAAAARMDNETDVYVLHGYGATKQEQVFVNQLLKNNKPFVFILGVQSRPQFTEFDEAGMRPSFVQGGVAEVQGKYNSGFTDFLTDDFARELRYWPPLKVPSGKYNVPAGFRTMVLQKIGAVETAYPLIGFTTVDNARQAWIFGEGLWKWRLFDQKDDAHTDAFDQFVVRTIQYLSTGELKNKFRVFTEKNTFRAGEQVKVYAEYLDASGNLVNKPDSRLTIKGPGYSKSAVMTRTGNRYLTDLGGLGQGLYTYTATLSSGAASSAGGKFLVEEAELELKNLTADHGLLRKLSAANRGAFFRSSQLGALTDSLLLSRYNKTVIRSEVKVTDFIHIRWIFVLLIFIFSAEWFLRKREGGY